MTTFDFGVEFDVDNSVPVPALKKISDEDINNFITDQKAQATVLQVLISLIKIAHSSVFIIYSISLSSNTRFLLYVYFMLTTPLWK